MSIAAWEIQLSLITGSTPKIANIYNSAKFSMYRHSPIILIGSFISISNYFTRGVITKSIFVNYHRKRTLGGFFFVKNVCYYF